MTRGYWQVPLDEEYVPISSFVTLFGHFHWLRLLDYSLPFCLAVDASDLAIGATLFQVVDGLEHPICFFSRKLDAHQKRYSTVEKEALSLSLPFATLACTLAQG